LILEKSELEIIFVDCLGGFGLQIFQCKW